jgi:hypothetical protein
MAASVFIMQFLEGRKLIHPKALDESSTKRRAATLQPECHQFDHILFRS